MIDLKEQEKRFKNHIATLADYGNIKVLDFKAPETNEYRIRFLFEEDYCNLHISGDLGELTAAKYNNMTYDNFNFYLDNVGCFKKKIDYASRKIYSYNEDLAKKGLLEFIREYDLEENLREKYDFEEIIDDILGQFSNEYGFNQGGINIPSTYIEYIDDFFEIAEDLGKESTGIIELYLLAFKLAKEQIDEKELKHDNSISSRNN